MKASIRWAMSVIAMLFVWIAPMAAHATATCNSANNNNALTAGTIAVPLGATPGMTVSTLAPVNYIVQCKFLANTPVTTTSTLTGRLATTTALASGYSDVYQTSISGLGVRYTLNSSADQCNLVNQTLQNGALSFTCQFSGPVGGAYIPYFITIVASLVVTGPIAPGASTLTSAPTITFALWTDDTGGPWNHTPAYSGAASGVLSQATCSVDQTNISVTMPTADSNNLTAIGATTAPKAFSLSLSCQSGATVLITLTDSVNPANRSNALQLTADSTAQGVGVQIVNGAGTAVSFGADSAAPGNTNQWSVGTSPNGPLQIPLTARYVRTGTVSPGTVKALATFTMSYQ